MVSFRACDVGWGLGLIGVKGRVLRALGKQPTTRVLSSLAAVGLRSAALVQNMGPDVCG